MSQQQFKGGAVRGPISEKNFVSNFFKGGGADNRSFSVKKFFLPKQPI